MGAGTIGLEIDDVAVRVPAGSTIFQAAEAAGYTPPHFCYHRDLSIPANCRMCLCEVEGQAKLQTSCSIAAAEGMVVRFDTPRVKSAVAGVLEFEFKNHPLDCPVCDQVCECYLQKYYLEVGKYEPLPIRRVVKDKVKDVGPITIDAVTPPKTMRVPNGVCFIRCSLKWPSAVFITRLVINWFSSGSTVLPRLWRITRPGVKSSK